MRRLIALSAIPRWCDLEGAASPFSLSASFLALERRDPADEEVAALPRLIRGNITSLGVDAIVNAANSVLLGGGGVDGAIHAAAGPQLLEACRGVPLVAPRVRCRVGDAVTTPGFDLPARFVVHTVGPHGNDEGRENALRSCYTRSLEEAVAVGARSVAFPSISTGVYGYPMLEAAGVATSAVRDFVEGHRGALDAVVFVVFTQDDYDTYAAWLPKTFPRAAGRVDRAADGGGEL